MRTRPGSCADVALRCEDCESATETTLVLSPEEAKLSAYTPCEIYRKRLNNPLHYGAPLR